MRRSGVRDRAVTDLSPEEAPLFQGFDCTRRPPLVSEWYLASWVEPSGGLDCILKSH